MSIPILPGPGHVIRIRGIVQGVGFRPTVWRLACGMGLAGDVMNDGAGVLVRLWGADPTAFLDRLRRELPALARIDSVEISATAHAAPAAGFIIAESGDTPPETAIAADAATCADCLRDIRDPGNRRYRYAFANCTNCGPRLSIIGSLPYDRCNTSMAAFAMCADCASEYADPADRRFHAQPVACPACGPRLWIENAGGAVLPGDAIATLAGLIGDGQIVAIKGIGGFHLACDACNESAVARLRARKHRDRKPFALMARDLAMVAAHAAASPAECGLLASPAAPIVLLDRKSGSVVASGVAPGHRLLGFMLPYTPLHHLLMAELGGPIVLTSGNLTEEPQCISNAEARKRLAGLADAYCLNDRAIVNRVDDSVMRLAAGGPITLRRARGLAPQSTQLHRSFAGVPPVLACGADLKVTAALLSGTTATVTQHIGDLATPLAREDYERSIGFYLQLYAAQPVAVASDLHADFHTSEVAAGLAARFDCRHVAVQHHHAHLAACMAEAGAAVDAPQCLGIILDGVGLGSDGAVWGGEFLIGGFAGFERAAHFPQVPLPGGDRASREPWRNAYAHIAAAIGWEEASHRYAGLPVMKRLAAMPVTGLAAMIAARRNAPPCSSAGRLFDAVAALLGISFERQDYEGEAAMLLEGLAAGVATGGRAYEIESSAAGWTWRGLFEGVLGDLERGIGTDVIARAFHDSLVRLLVAKAAAICGERGIATVALSGGCFNNVLLLDGVSKGLAAKGLEVMTHHVLPPGDGGISLGQAAIAARQWLAAEKM